MGGAGLGGADPLKAGCAGGAGGYGGNGGNGGGGLGGHSVPVAYTLGHYVNSAYLELIQGAPGEGGPGGDPTSTFSSGEDGWAAHVLALDP